MLRRIDEFLDERLPRAVKERERRSKLILSIDDEVGRIVDKLKKRGFTSPYLRAFVVARINPIRFHKGPNVPPFDATLDKMIASARRFDAGSVNASQVARASGPPDGE